MEICLELEDFSKEELIEVINNLPDRLVKRIKLSATNNRISRLNKEWIEAAEEKEKIAKEMSDLLENYGSMKIDKFFRKLHSLQERELDNQRNFDKLTEQLEEYEL